MIQAIILYGSRARNDGEPSSDVDLLGVAEDGRIQKPYDVDGLSFHVYPLQWMLENSVQGSLFLLHVASEAKAVFDPENTLELIRKSFEYKATYNTDIETGARIVFAVTSLDESQFSDKMRARYFWGLRTAIMASAADQRQPRFASKLLEQFCGVDGLAAHIQGRRTATLSECRGFGERVIRSLGHSFGDVFGSDTDKNLRMLLEAGGVATATAGAIVYGV